MKLFFPHIIVDFDLPMAMKQGLVKLLLLDRRQELTDLENLDYNAERDEQGKVVGLSEGQRMMLRAGLTKLGKLEEEFLKVDPSKNPKMLIVCQDTTVSPFVEEFLKSEGLGEDDIVTIDSNKQGAGERSSRLAFLHVPYDDDLRLTCLVGYPRTSAPEP